MAVSTARRPLPAMAFLLVLTVLTAIVWWRVLHRSSSSDGATPVPVTAATCAKPGTKPLKLPAARTVTVVVLNGSGRDLLATQVSTQLKARGFQTGAPGDAPSPYAGTAEIEYGRAGKAAATLLSYYVPGSRLIASSRADAALNLILGSGYHSLATQAVVNSAVTRATKPCA